MSDVESKNEEPKDENLPGETTDLRTQEVKNSPKKLLISVLVIFAAIVLFSRLVTYLGSGDSLADAKAVSDLAKQNDFSEDAEDDLQMIGTQYPDRNLSGSSQNSNDHEAAKQWILSELKSAGYKTEAEGAKLSLSEDTFAAAAGENQTKETGDNLIAVLPGTGKKQVIVGAHYDGDGAGDNGSGAALLLAESMGLGKAYEKGDIRPEASIVFIFFDGEEDGELGSSHYVSQMSSAEKHHTICMINLDSLAFGDYCSIYGGESVSFGPFHTVKGTKPYRYAMKLARYIGMDTMDTDDLDGYYAKHGSGPAIAERTLYTNPWTFANPSPKNFEFASPSTGGWGDHAPFSDAGIDYIYFEATNWYAKGDGGSNAYTGYFDTDRTDLGENGMFMNTKYDTLENLQTYFPGRSLAHYQVFSPLLSALCLLAADM